MAAESEHFAAELMGCFGKGYKPCIALTTNSSLITALANDLGYGNVFAHQVSILGTPKDVLIVMTSSASLNVRKALSAGCKKGMITVVLCSKKSPGFRSDYVFKMGDDTVEMQNEAVKFLHRLAMEIKQ